MSYDGKFNAAAYAAYRRTPPVDSTLTCGTQALGAALIALPRHRFDQGKPSSYLRTLIDQFVTVPDEVLFAVADEILDLTASGELVEQPRDAALKEMVNAALHTHNALAQLLAKRA
jgi:hypothetical protein